MFRRLPFTWRQLAVPFASALALRFAMLVLVAHQDHGGDMDWYKLVADNILHHGTFSDDAAAPYMPSLYRPPLYPAFVALMRLVGAEHFAVLQIAQSLLGALLVVVLGSAVGTFSKRHGRMTMWLVALSPFEAVYCGAMLSETLATFFLVTGIAAPLLLRDPWRWGASGALLALAALTRDVFMLFIPAFAVVAVVVLGAPRRRALPIVLFAALTILPWTCRNYSVTHAIVPISRSSFAHSLFIGTWVRDTSHLPGGRLARPEEMPPFAWKLAGERELYDEWGWYTEKAERLPRERDHVYMQMFERRLANDPGGVIASWIRRAPYVWVGTTRFDLFEFRSPLLARGTTLNRVVKLFLFALNGAAIALGMIGVVLAVRRGSRRYLLFALPVVYTLAVLTPLGVVEPRYTQPVLPCLIVMACLTLRVARVAWLRRASRRRPATTISSA
jgi:hypothetical protein